MLQLFEQFRKGLKLNKSNRSLEAKEKSDKLKTLKTQFYDGLIDDLIAQKAFKLAQIIYGEKKREKFDQTVKD